MEKKQYVCSKCGNTWHESDRFQVTGGNSSKILDVRNKKFITASCICYGYAELYKQETDTGWNILSFFIGN